MAAKTTLNARNLQALGVERLAELLIEISTGSAAHKRRLRLELAGSQGSEEVSREVRKRLGSIARARTFIDWRKVRKLHLDLETQRRTIVERVGPDDPNEAFDLIWQFLALADPVFERSDDGSGTLLQSFHQACADAGALAEAAAIKPGILAQKVFLALKANDDGQFEPLIGAMSRALGSAGLQTLKAHLVAWSRERVDSPPQDEREVIARGPNGPVYFDTVYGRRHIDAARRGQEEIADIEGGADDWIALQPEDSRSKPHVAAEIARRLLAAGRATEALAVLDGADHGHGSRHVPGLIDDARSVRLDVLDALGRNEESQAARWAAFERSLDDRPLRDYLRRLPDFDDVEAEEKAFAHVHAAQDAVSALAFFLGWPSLAHAARLVIARKTEMDGDRYEIMTPAAEALAPRHPLAATILLRSMIDFALDRTRAGRYKHAARHLAECAALAPHIAEFGDSPGHDAYVADLRRRHTRKPGFWNLVS
jgi:hypothetical protein